MQRALYTAASGMSARQLTIETIAHNLANMGTHGYKRRRAEFQDLLYQTLRPAGARTGASTVAPAALEVGLGVRPAATSVILSQGEAQGTQRPLDVAINGDGYFAVRQPDGELAYTRAGSFQLSADGELITQEGDPVEPSISIPPEAIAIQIARDGTVSVHIAADTEPQNVGQLELSVFANAGGLESLGRNLFRPTAASGDPSTVTPTEDNAGELLQGFLEGSNVDVVQEFVDMILAQRGYEAISRVLKSADEMYTATNNATR